MQKKKTEYNLNPQNPIYWPDNLTHTKLFAETMEKLSVNSKPRKNYI